MALALSEVQLVSRLQTHFMRLAQLSAAAEVEFVGYAARLQGRVLEAQTAVEYAVSRALLGDKASAFVADDKVAQAEEEYARCEAQARDRRGVEEVRCDCRQKLAEVRAHVERLRQDLEQPVGGGTAAAAAAASAAAAAAAAAAATAAGMDGSVGSISSSNSSYAYDRWRSQQSSAAAQRRHTAGSGKVHTIGAGGPPPSLSAMAARASSSSVAVAAAGASPAPATDGGAEFTFGAAKVRSNLEEVEAVADHVEDLLARESAFVRGGGGSSGRSGVVLVVVVGGGGGGVVGDEALLAEAIDNLDVCFDLLWEARALADARAAFRRHRGWQLRLQRLLRAVRGELGDLEQQVAQARWRAAAFVESVVAKNSHHHGGGGSSSSSSTTTTTSAATAAAVALAAATGGTVAGGAGGGGGGKLPPPSELHRQAELQRLTDSGIAQLDGMLADATAAVEEFAEFVASGGNGGSGGTAAGAAGNGGGNGGDEAAEHELEVRLQGCRSEFATVRQRLANPLYSASPMASPRRTARSSSPAAGGAASLQSRDAAAAAGGNDGDDEDTTTDVATELRLLRDQQRAAASFDDSATTNLSALLHHSDDDDNNVGDAGVDDGDFFPAQDGANAGGRGGRGRGRRGGGRRRGGGGSSGSGGSSSSSSDEYEYDEPAILSASQLARRARVRREVLTVLRVRRRRHQLQLDEAAERDRRAAEQRRELLQRQQQRHQRESAKVRAATREQRQQQQQQEEKQKKLKLKQKQQLATSSALADPNFFHSRAKITHLPAAAAPEFAGLGPLFFPGTEAAAAAAAASAGGGGGGGGGGGSGGGGAMAVVVVAAGDVAAMAAAAAAQRRNNDVVRLVMATPSVDLAGFLRLAEGLAASASSSSSSSVAMAAPLVDSAVARVFRVVDVRGQGSVPPFELLLGVLVALFAARHVSFVVAAPGWLAV